MTHKTTLQGSQFRWLGLAVMSVLTIGMLSSAHADIFKVTKPDGQVVFTDNPPVGQSAQDVKVERVNVPNYTPPAPTTNANNTQTDTQAVNKAKTLTNYSVRITNPSEERAYRKPVQNVEVAVVVSPSLQDEDVIEILLDGTAVATGTAASLPTETMTPGAHTLNVQVKRSDGSMSGSDSMTFYVIQNNPALQRKVRFEEQMRAYQQLPWYQKMLMKLKGEKPVLNLDNNASDAFRP